MKTIGEMILRNEMEAAALRLARLKELGAPRVMIESQERIVEQYETATIADLKFNGDRDLLERSYVTAEVKTGRRGKEFVVFDCGVTYFPHAAYGRFITLTETAEEKAARKR